MHTFRNLPLIVVLFCCNGLPSARADRAPDMAGFAQADVTPPVGIELGGRGCSEDVSEKVLDPLLAQATVIQDATGSRLVIVSLDLIGLGREYGPRLRDAIATRLGVPPGHVLLNCSHTHSGPMMYREVMAGCGEPKEQERAYLETLARKVLELCLLAQSRLEPARLSVHQGTCDVAIDRRRRLPDGATRMLPNPQGPYDPRVWILRVEGTDGTLRGVLFSYACHPTIVYTTARKVISADYPGAARRAVATAVGDAVHTQFLQGCAGSVRPRILANMDTLRFRAARPDDHVRAGESLGAAIVDAFGGAGRPLALGIAARAGRVELRRGQPPERSFYERLATEDDHRGRAARYWLEQYDRGGPQEKSVSWAVGVVRLAPDQWICWFSGEPVVQWGALVRKWLGDREVVTLGYMQESFGYLPIDAMLAEGGYEVIESNHFRIGNPAPFAPGINASVRDGVLRQLRDIEGAASRPE